MNNTASATNSTWQFWVDRGGTFTDLIAKDPKGVLHTHKLLSENPEQYSDAAIAGIRYFLGLSKSEEIPSETIKSVKMGTTVATNALLERKGDDVALLTNKGFKNALQIGYQNRPDIFALEIKKPPPLYKTSVEISGRLNAKGLEVEALCEKEAKAVLQRLKQQGYDALAIVFLHGYLNPAHEKQVAQWAIELGFSQVSTSHQTSSLVKYISRGRTTVVDAYLSPILRRYVDQVANAIPNIDLQFMQSHGGLTSAHEFQGKDAILSGPAGGIVAAVETAHSAGFKKIIGFDMGGTSTDVSHYAGHYERSFETEVAGIEMRVPMLDIHTVAAGGGSIISQLQNEILVGPESAGANPGPSCYRRGGPLTVTDCNLLLGRIQPQFFPQVFGENANQPLDYDTVHTEFKQLARSVNKSSEELAAGALAIAVENMANAVQKISTQKGYDLADYTLVSFGGAGGQHACAVAEHLGIKQVLFHPYSGVLSAYGMGLARKRVIETQSYATPLSDLFTNPQVEKRIAQQREAATHRLLIQNERVQTLQTTLHLNYSGSETILDISMLTEKTLKKYEQEFEQRHKNQFGFIQTHAQIMINSISVEAVSSPSHSNNDSRSAPHSLSKKKKVNNVEHVKCYLDSAWQTVPVYNRHDIKPGAQITGPAMVLESTGTILIPTQWHASLLADGHLLITHHPLIDNHKEPNSLMNNDTEADPVQLSLFNNRFMSIAEQMGATLAKTAHSVNIKERLDFSCALFDQEGQLIANAPHVPVHLGSMGDSVKTVIQRVQKGTISPLHSGDAYALNNPYAGGTHLPDITLITPVVIDNNIEFYVASRGHHADVGGLTPGSMPANSKHIEEEGVLLDCVQAVKSDVFQTETITAAFTGAKYPVRNLPQNLNDLQAQVAANQQGINGLKKLCENYGLIQVKNYMKHVLNHAENTVKSLIKRLKKGRYSYETDQGNRIEVEITPYPLQNKLTIDFTGSSGQVNSNFNAPHSITRAATLYVLRTLVNQPIPLNDGFLKPVELIIPAGSMLNPTYPAAVVAGNVETSQVVTDCLYGALQTQAASQGTMNNLTFGNNTWQYYETICGGTGAGKSYHGTSAVHSHMTNSRLTDPEILELRYPVQLDKFDLHINSGGKGLFNGGDGCERQFKFLTGMTVSMLTNHRRVVPYGMQGGEPGKPGAQKRRDKSGRETSLASTFSRYFNTGETLIIKTPGGGGYGHNASCSDPKNTQSR